MALKRIQTLSHYTIIYAMDKPLLVYFLKEGRGGGPWGVILLFYRTTLLYILKKSDHHIKFWSPKSLLGIELLFFRVWKHSKAVSINWDYPSNFEVVWAVWLDLMKMKVNSLLTQISQFRTFGGKNNWNWLIFGAFCSFVSENSVHLVKSPNLVTLI